MAKCTVEREAPNPPPIKKVILELSLEEAMLLRVITGNMASTNRGINKGVWWDRSAAIWTALDTVGIPGLGLYEIFEKYSLIAKAG